MQAKAKDLGFSVGRLARITDWMQGYLEAGRLPGAITLVARRGEVAYLEVMGFGDVEADRPLAEDTIFRIYSMTKPVTAVAVMMLYEEGLFRLSDPVSAYLPEFTDMQVWRSGEGAAMICEPARSPITIGHLLTHTAGLTYGFNTGNPVAELYLAERLDFDPQDGPLAGRVERIAAMPLVAHPGERWIYSVSFDVLGWLVEFLSGHGFDRFLHERIFAPLGMVDTGFELPASKADRFAALYEATEDDGMKLVEGPGESMFARDVTCCSGGGGLLSTLADYFRFAEMLRRRGELEGVRILGRKTVDFMVANHLPDGRDLAAMGQSSFCETSFEGMGFGLGMSVVLDPARAQQLCSPGEFAWGGMASTAFWVDPLEDITVLFLTQLIPSDRYPIRPELRTLVNQALVD